jgi:hypothetical protein
MSLVRCHQTTCLRITARHTALHAELDVCGALLAPLAA